MKVFEPCPGIKVYDDVFTYTQQYRIYGQIVNDLKFSIGWSDSFEDSDKFLHTAFPAETWRNINYYKSPEHFVNELNNSEPFQELKDHHLLKSIINLTTIADTNIHHTHPGQEAMLYYANLEWKNEWQGETFFLDPEGKNILYTSPYVPNRMIWFDGDIVHRFNTQSRTAPKYRFSVSTFWEKPIGLDEVPPEVRDGIANGTIDPREVRGLETPEPTED